MTSHSSATALEETPHVTETSRTTTNISLKRRAQSLLKDRSVDAQTRSLIRYALEIDDPRLAQLVRRVDAGETIIDRIDLAETTENSDDDSSEKIEALAEMICYAGDEPATALLVLMATLENSVQPKVLANTAKHIAFTHCGELNLNGMVDAGVALLESKLLAVDTLAA